MFDMQKRRPIEQASFDVDFAVLLAGLNTVSTGEGTSEAKFEHFWTGVILALCLPCNQPVAVVPPSVAME